VNAQTFVYNEFQPVGGYKDLSDLVLSTPSDISRTTRLPLNEVTRILETACRECAPPINKIKDLPLEGEEKFTTGDAELDGMLGGGIRTGMLWEVVGERCECFGKPDRTKL
jgi:DNA repair protein RAD57